MASAVRVLPALIAVSIGVLAFKGVDIYQAVAQAVDGEAGPPPPETELTAGVGDRPSESADAAAAAEGASSTPAAPKADVCLPSLDYAAELGITSQEVLVLRSLADRRKELDEREAGVETREQAAAAAEIRLQEQIGELKKVESEVQALLASMDAKRDERMTALIKTYEAMKPKDAAVIFDGMDDKILIDLAKGMKPANLAPIMQLMQPKRAEELTRMLSDLAKPPTSIDALQKAPI
jgi:flagellar motility protein MotE (MotC chaperone)